MNSKIVKSIIKDSFEKYTKELDAIKSELIKKPLIHNNLTKKDVERK